MTTPQDDRRVGKRRTRGYGTGSVCQLQNGKYAAAFALPNGKRKTVYGKTKSEVQSKLLDARIKVSQGVVVPTGKETLARFLERWLRDTTRHRVRASTLERYRGDVLLHIVPELGTLRLNEVTPSRVQGMINKLQAKGLSPASIRHVRAVLRRALQQALHEGLLAQNSAKLVETPRVVKQPVKALTPEDARELLLAFRDHPLEVAVTVALASGLRQGNFSDYAGLMSTSPAASSRSTANSRERAATASSPS